MEYLEIGLLILGALFFIGSFFLQEKLSSSDVDEIKKMSEKQIGVLMEKQLRDADMKIDGHIGETLNASLEKLERESDKETNEKLMQIGEYSDSVMEKMGKTHEEIMFIYQMLNEKQDKLTQLTKDAQDYESHLRSITEEMSKKTQTMQSQEDASRVERDTAVKVIMPVIPEPAPEILPPEPEETVYEEPVEEPVMEAVMDTPAPEAPVAAETPVVSEAPSTAEVFAEESPVIEPAAETVAPEAAPEVPVPEAAVSATESAADTAEKPAPEPPAKKKSSRKKPQPKIELAGGDDDNKEQIISMFKQGYTQVEIAKKIGVGLGEIQLILGLYGEGAL